MRVMGENSGGQYGNRDRGECVTKKKGVRLLAEHIIQIGPPQV
jgi:hypothetical protein